MSMDSLSTSLERLPGNDQSVELSVHGHGKSALAEIAKRR